MLASKLLSACGGSETLYVDDVFSTWLYTGNGSTQTITNGIDLAGKGGLVWLKNRSSASDHRLFDTSRGIASGSTNALTTNNTNAQTNYTNGFGVNQVFSDGFGIGNSGVDTNNSGQNYVSWTFRKAAKFFDCGTYTGNGVAGRQIPHSLGVAPGMVIVKRTNDASNWTVWHRSFTSAQYIELNLTGGVQSSTSEWNNTAPNASAFTVGAFSSNNGNGDSYVWYAFAHDTSAEGIIQCGSFTTDGSGNATVTLPWEPQYVMHKRSDSTSSWQVMDSIRGMPVTANSSTTTGGRLYPNLSNADDGFPSVIANATGFTTVPGTINTSATYIYLAIRRPNKPPTTGTQVYNAIARTGTGASNLDVNGAGFPPDFLIGKRRDSTGNNVFYDRLRGTSQYIYSNSTGAEANVGGGSLEGRMLMDGFTVDGGFGLLNNNAATYINHFFRRAPGVFDVVCTSNTTIDVSHNLGVVPELLIQKRRNNVENWYVAAYSSPTNQFLFLNTTSAAFGGLAGSLTSTKIPAGSSPVGSASTASVFYLFASSPGISKVGSYTGNGSSQTIDCGFSAGARFCLIKRTDSTGDWYVWDSVRGIVAANDPHLSLNTTAAEVTSNDSIDPTNAGFVVNQVAATNVNVTSATYIYLAYA